MYNPFNENSNFYPVRWFLVLIAVLTMSMSYFDYTGNRFLGYTVINLVTATTALITMHK